MDLGWVGVVIFRPHSLQKNVTKKDCGRAATICEKLRLRGIDAPELETAEGAKSSAALKRILKNTQFLVVKTSAVDVYGRYVCDVFLPENSAEIDAQKVADSGIFPNQLLLNKGLATRV